MLAEMRTGSNFLEMNLNGLQGFTCHGEVFNPYLLGNHTNKQLFGFTLEQRDADPLAMLREMRLQTPGLGGFRYFHDHDPRVLDTVLADDACAKIILTRNPVESYVSWKIALETDQWRLMNTRRHTTARPKFDAAEFEAHLEKLQQFQIHLLNRLQTSGQTAFYLDYEDIQSVEVLNGLAAFLGVQDRLKAIDTTLKKQNPEAIEDKVSNPKEMAASLARMDRFNLGRTPNFEPRRNAGVPQYVASTGAPLLYLPISGGPNAAVKAWLEGFGKLTTDFDRKSLKRWKETQVGHRSFAVLRHPLARAHAAFCEFLARNQQPELRPYLAKFHRLPLPAPGKDFPNPEEFRAAFLVFLSFLKRNLSGQTGLKVIPQFASQTAILQGFAQLYPADLVLREDRIETGLEFLAAEAGLPAPVYIAQTNDVSVPLDAIYGPDLEAAAREAYERDYAGFGFGNWRADSGLQSI